MLKINNRKQDRHDPAFFAGSIKDVIDLDSKVIMPRNAFRASWLEDLRQQGKFIISTDRIDGNLPFDENRDEVFNIYKLNDRLIKCWSDNIGPYKPDVVNSVSQVFKQDNSHWLSSLEFIRQLKCCRKPKGWKGGAFPTKPVPFVKLFGRSENSIYSYCLAQIHLDIN